MPLLKEVTLLSLFSKSLHIFPSQFSHLAQIILMCRLLSKYVDVYYSSLAESRLRKIGYA